MHANDVYIEDINNHYLKCSNPICFKKFPALTEQF